MPTWEEIFTSNNPAGGRMINVISGVAGSEASPYTADNPAGGRAINVNLIGGGTVGTGFLQIAGGVLDTTLRVVTDNAASPVSSPLQLSTTQVAIGGVTNPVFLLNGTNNAGAARNWAIALNQSYNGAFEISYGSTNGGTALANVALTINNTGSVGIGFATSPVATALLQLNSTTKGFLPPRLTGAQATTLEAASPAQGLLIFVTSINGTFSAIGWWGYNGTTWQQL